MNSKPILALGAVFVLIILGFFLFRAGNGSNQSTGGSPASTATTTVAEGNLAPDFSLEAFDGQTVSLTSQKEKAVFVDFWAAWCPFCIDEMPEIEKIAQEFKDDLVVLGIHRTETENVKTGEKFAQERGVTYSLLKDTDGSVYKAYTQGRNFMPAAAFINKEGKVVKFLYGPKTDQQMRQYVREALEETN